MNQTWRTVKSESRKSKRLINIATNDITEWNDLIYTNAELVFEKIRVPLKNTSRNSKPRWELRLESQIKRIRQQAKILNRTLRKFKFWTKLKNRDTNNSKKLKETKQGILAKEGRLKRYQVRAKQYSQNRTFQSNEKKSTNKMGENRRTHIKNRVRERQEDFWAKYGSGKILKNPNG